MALHQKEQLLRWLVMLLAQRWFEVLVKDGVIQVALGSSARLASRCHRTKLHGSNYRVYVLVHEELCESSTEE